jgi:hypothetical protein
VELVVLVGVKPVELVADEVEEGEPFDGLTSILSITLLMQIIISNVELLEYVRHDSIPQLS